MLSYSTRLQWCNAEKQQNKWSNSLSDWLLQGKKCTQIRLGLQNAGKNIYNGLWGENSEENWKKH